MCDGLNGRAGNNRRDRRAMHEILGGAERDFNGHLAENKKLRRLRNEEAEISDDRNCVA